jgi:hypothetical protein
MAVQFLNTCTDKAVLSGGADAEAGTASPVTAIAAQQTTERRRASRFRLGAALGVFVAGVRFVK